MAYLLSSVKSFQEALPADLLKNRDEVMKHVYPKKLVISNSHRVAVHDTDPNEATLFPNKILGLEGLWGHIYRLKTLIASDTARQEMEDKIVEVAYRTFLLFSPLYDGAADKWKKNKWCYGHTYDNWSQTGRYLALLPDSGRKVLTTLSYFFNPFEDLPESFKDKPWVHSSQRSGERKKLIEIPDRWCNRLGTPLEKFLNRIENSYSYLALEHISNFLKLEKAEGETALGHVVWWHIRDIGLQYHHADIAYDKRRFDRRIWNLVEYDVSADTGIFIDFIFAMTAIWCGHPNVPSAYDMVYPGEVALGFVVSPQKCLAAITNFMKWVLEFEGEKLENRGEYGLENRLRAFYKVFKDHQVPTPRRKDEEVITTKDLFRFSQTWYTERRIQILNASDDECRRPELMATVLPQVVKVGPCCLWIIVKKPTLTAKEWKQNWLEDKKVEVKIDGKTIDAIEAGFHAIRESFFYLMQDPHTSRSSYMPWLGGDEVTNQNALDPKRLELVKDLMQYQSAVLQDEWGIDVCPEGTYWTSSKPIGIEPYNFLSLARFIAAFTYYPKYPKKTNEFAVAIELATHPLSTYPAHYNAFEEAIYKSSVGEKSPLMANLAHPDSKKWAKNLEDTVLPQYYEWAKSLDLDVKYAIRFALDFLKTCYYNPLNIVFCNFEHMKRYASRQLVKRASLATSQKRTDKSIKKDAQQHPISPGNIQTISSDEKSTSDIDKAPLKNPAASQLPTPFVQVS